MNILFFGGNRFFGKKLLKKLIRKKGITIYLVNRGNRSNFKFKNIIHLKSDRKNIKFLKKKIDLFPLFTK